VSGAANVAYSDSILNATAFNKYEASGEEVGIKLDKLEKVLDGVSRDSELHIYYDDETRSLNISSEGQEFQLSTLPSDEVSLPDFEESDIEFDSTVVLGGEEISKAINLADKFSDYMEVDIDTEERELILTGSGDTDMTERRISESDMETFEPGDVSSVYSLDLLTSLTKVMKESNTVKIRLSEISRPMKLRIPIADGKGHIKYYISPRIS
jgi:DNA polymerase III sliding clamp (beta) subunit (PCNA family)